MELNELSIFNRNYSISVYLVWPIISEAPMENDCSVKSELPPAVQGDEFEYPALFPFVELQEFAVDSRRNFPVKQL